MGFFIVDVLRTCDNNFKTEGIIKDHNEFVS